MNDITKELAKLFRKITNSEIDAEGNAHVILSPADSLLINNARIALASLEAEAVALEKREELRASANRVVNQQDIELQELRQRNAELVEALEKAQQSPIMPLGLHQDTQKLVSDFCTALAEKLYKAQLKYGYDTDWKQDGWPSQCQAHFHQHIAKGDPRDVAAYCAFMWWHGWSTKPAEGLESRTVTVNFPRQTDFDDPLSAYEAIEKCRDEIKSACAAAGIQVIEGEG